jgi:hypothetical protein
MGRVAYSERGEKVPGIFLSQRSAVRIKIIVQDNCSIANHNQSTNNISL